MEPFRKPSVDHAGDFFPGPYLEENLEPSSYFYPHHCCYRPLSGSSPPQLSLNVLDRVLSPSEDFSPVSVSAYLHSDYQCTTASYKNFDVTEIRKEKSRDAARNRRGKENHEFLGLSRLLPLPGAITSQLDKASIVRLCISSLKLRSFCLDGDPSWATPNLRLSNNKPGSQLVSTVRASKDTFDATFGSTILQAHDGFVAALSLEGNILYISETVSIYLGLSQVELTGSSIFEYIHEDDRVEFSEASGIPYDPSTIIPHDLEGGSTSVPSNCDARSDSDSDPAEDRPPVEVIRSTMSYKKMSPTKEPWRNGHRKTALCIRFRSTLTKRGVQMRYSGYRVLSLQIQPRFAAEESDFDGTTVHYDKLRTSGTSNSGEPQSKLGYVVFATALPSLNINELRLDQSSVTTKMTLDLKILSCDLRLEAVTGCPTDRLIGASFYSLCYGTDVEIVKDIHDDVLRKGQSISSYYRLLNRTGGFSWVQTGAHLMTASKSPGDPQCIVAVHNFMSEAHSQQEPLFTLPQPFNLTSHLSFTKKSKKMPAFDAKHALEESHMPLIGSLNSQTIYSESEDLQLAALRNLQFDKTFTSTNCDNNVEVDIQEKSSSKKKMSAEKNRSNVQFQEAVLSSNNKNSKRSTSKDSRSVRKKAK